jgi:hypothetical protein
LFFKIWRIQISDVLTWPHILRKLFRGRTELVPRTCTRRGQRQTSVQTPSACPSSKLRSRPQGNQILFTRLTLDLIELKTIQSRRGTSDIDLILAFLYMISGIFWKRFSWLQSNIPNYESKHLTCCEHLQYGMMKNCVFIFVSHVWKA